MIKIARRRYIHLLASTICLLLLGFFAPCGSYAQALTLPTDAGASGPPVDSIDLSGTWLMKVGDTPGNEKVDLGEADWAHVKEPGANAPAGYVWYRKEFNIPADWKTDAAVVQFARLNMHLGVITGAIEVYFNGNPIGILGTMPGVNGTGYKPYDPPTSDIAFGVPLTCKSPTGTVPTFNFGELNLIALKIYKPDAGPNPSAGAMSLDKPDFSEIYSADISTSSPDNLATTFTKASINVALGNTTDKVVPLNWELHIANDLGQTPKGLEPRPQTGSINPGKADDYNLTLGFPDPGVYNIKLVSKIDGHPMPTRTLNLGYDVDLIHPEQTAPADFVNFWTEVRKDSETAPLNAQITKDSSADGVTSYTVKYTGLDGKPAFGWLSVPDHIIGDPVLLFHLAPYHGDATAPNVEWAKKGYIVFEFLATATSPTSGNADQHYFVDGVSSPKTYFLRNAAGNMLRAVALLKTDGAQAGVPASAKLVLWGESQGGGLALIGGGLLKHDVAAIVAESPYFTDMPRILHAISTDIQNPFTDAAKPSVVGDTLSYFDTVNFATKVTAPTFIAVGLEDNISPAYGAFGFAALMTAPHTTAVFPNDGHIPEGADAKALAWLKTTLK